MNADGRALFAAICADPEDDTSRLVYADWLDEQGDSPRAEALRMSVERRRLPDWEPRAWVLDARLERMRDKYQKVWAAELPEFVDGYLFTGCSGLVEEVRVWSPRALFDQDELISRTGPITSVDVSLLSRNNDLQDASLLASCPSMARVRRLELSGIVPPTALALPTLAASPYFSNLRHLERKHCRDEDELLEYLADCPPFPNLESLKLDSADFETPGCAALSRSPILQKLLRLEVGFARASEGGLHQLMRSPHFRQLRELLLSPNCLSSRSFERFFEIDWQRLEHLDLSSNSLTPATCRHLARCPGMSRLRWLDFSGSHTTFGDAGLKAIARSPHLEHLRVLDIGFNTLSHAGIDALSHADWASNLARLDLIGTGMGPREFTALGSSSFGNLRWLGLGYGQITDAEIPKLLDVPWLNQLTHLDLNNNSIGDAGARLLVESPLDNLEFIDLSVNEIPGPARELLRERFGDRVRLDDWPAK